MRRPLLDATITAALATSLALIYRDSLLSYLETIQIPDYGYLLVLAPTAITITAVLAHRYGSIEGLDVYRAASALIAVLLAYIIHGLALLQPEHSLQLETLSVVILVAGTLLLVYGEFNHPAIPLSIWLLLLMLTPIPRGIIDQLSQQLTQPVAKIAALLTGAKLGTTGPYTTLTFKDNQGVLRAFQIAPECSGIVSLLSTLALTPAILYLTATSIAPRRRKATTATIAIITAAVTVLLGNTVRVALVVYTAQHYNYQQALKLFHQTPSIIYVTIATILSLTITLRLPRSGTQSEKPRTNNQKITPTDIAKSILITSLITLQVILAAQTGQPLTTNQQPLQLTPEQIIQNPTIILNTTNKTIKTIPRPIIGEALGALATYQIIIKKGNNTYQGWLEIAETPTRFHSWHVCLQKQTYKIVKTWTEVINKTTITYIIIKRNDRKLLLAYATFRIPTYKTSTYMRISLITYKNIHYNKNYESSISDIRSILEHFYIKINSYNDQGKNINNLIIISLLTLIIILIKIITLMVKS